MKKHLAKDPVMAQIMKEVRLPKINPAPNVFNALLSSITSQQLSTTVAAVIYDRVKKLYGGKRITPKMILNTDHETLRSVGLSNQKTNYFFNIASFFNTPGNKRIKWAKLTDQEIIDRLTTIKGVGEWTVQMILMFTLGRPDILPVKDLGIQLSMKQFYGIKGEKKILYKRMEKIAAQWSPHQTLASRYLWAARDKS